MLQELLNFMVEALLNFWDIGCPGAERKSWETESHVWFRNQIFGWFSGWTRQKFFIHIWKSEFTSTVAFISRWGCKFSFNALVNYQILPEFFFFLSLFLFHSVLGESLWKLINYLMNSKATFLTKKINSLSSHSSSVRLEDSEI